MLFKNLFLTNYSDSPVSGKTCFVTWMLRFFIFACIREYKNWLFYLIFIILQFLHIFNYYLFIQLFFLFYYFIIISTLFLSFFPFFFFIQNYHQYSQFILRIHYCRKKSWTIFRTKRNSKEKELEKIRDLQKHYLQNP